MNYEEFLSGKIIQAPVSGFDVRMEELNAALLPHQRDAVLWALRGGQRAIFASFGLGKSAMQIEFCHQCVKRFGGKALIVLPLGVRQEFTHDATELLGYDAPRYVTSMEEIAAQPDGSILLTNYERARKRKKYNRAYNRRYYAEQKAELNAKSRAYHAAHQKLENARSAAWRQRNPEYCVAYQQAYYDENRALILVNKQSEYEVNRALRRMLESEEAQA